MFEYVYVCTRVCVCTHLRERLCTYVCMYVCVRVYTRLCTKVCTLHIYLVFVTCMDSTDGHTCTYVYTRVYVSVCGCEVSTEE